MQNPEHARVQRTELNPWLVYLVSAMADECGYPALGRVGRAEPALHCVRPVVDHHVVSDHAKLDQQTSTSVARQGKVRIMDSFPPDVAACCLAVRLHDELLLPAAPRGRRRLLLIC